MTREKLNTYRDLYSQLVDQLVKFHRTHINFVQKSNFDRTRFLRSDIRALRVLLKKLYDFAPEVKSEHSDLYFKSADYRKRKNKKNEQHNNSNENSV
jgi:hypothetical protein